MARILIAEDEPRISAFVEKGLSANGFTVTVVGDGPSAYDYAMTGGFDLMILDIGLPGIDGFAVLRKLRAERNPIPVIVLTTRDTVQDTVAGLEGGADDYMPQAIPVRRAARPRSASHDDRAANRTHGAVPTAGCTWICGPVAPESTTTPWIPRRASSHSPKPSYATPARYCPANSWSATSGATTSTPAPTSSTSTCAICGAKLGTDRFVTLRGMGYRLDEVP
jgi:two-component system copper resistance phosphate regulon response regulator CusR